MRVSLGLGEQQVHIRDIAERAHMRATLSQGAGMAAIMAALVYCPFVSPRVKDTDPHRHSWRNPIRSRRFWSTGKRRTRHCEYSSHIVGFVLIIPGTARFV